MVGKSLFCGCFGKKLKRNESGSDQPDTYNQSTTGPQRLAPIVAFEGTQENSDPNEPSTSSSQVNVNPNQKRHLFGLSWRKHKDRKLPQIPPKSVTFSRVQDIPHIDDPIPTYESIDADMASDSNYSKMEDRRYDYPIFPQRMINRRRNLEENLYASASQTYSVGSEDPYSSIATNDDASVGYARVNEEQMRRQKPTSSSNVDDLYAKVNRKNVVERRIQNGLLSSSSGLRNLQQIQPSTSGTFLAEADDYQMEESGSGSITSSGSCNPSYRYLTVRETLGVIRERIRRRNEEASYATTDTNPATKEHYYSTISNDYESVRNDPPISNQSPQPSTSTFTPQDSAFQSNRNSLLLNELKINTNNLTNGQVTHFRPPAPTSPVPQLPSTSNPASTTKNRSDSAAVSDIDINLPLLASSTNRANPALTHAQLPPFPPITPRILCPLQNNRGIQVAYAESMTSRPIVISMASVLRKHGSTPNIKYMKSIGTSTDDLFETKPKKSKIPRLVNHRIYSKFDHQLLTKSQESPIRLKKSLKRPPSLGFIPVGNDYVSLIDFSRSETERGWPFDRTL